MARLSLIERLRAFEQRSDLSPPTSFQPGRDSLLGTLQTDGTLTRDRVAAFLASETGHVISTATRLDLRNPLTQLRDREVFEIRGAEDAYGLTWPQDFIAVDEILRRCARPIFEILSLPELEENEVTQVDDREVVQSILQDLGSSDADIEVVNSFDLADDVADLADEAPIIKLLNMILLRAFKDEASDIHIEAEENVTRVRYRVDGELREVMHSPKKFHNAIVSRVKIMSDLDIAEKRTPQDGRMKLKLGRDGVDVRVSTLPSVYGEKVVMRILREGSLVLGIEDIGFSESQIQVYRSIITRPYGILLVTGPTGSGKTTTLYSTLRYLNSKSKNIITIEDPVEYQVENINQIQVNRKAGIDFASGLKSILRQDPDIIMIGEMRDEETASIAVKAALTGHLVFSTLHTNDAPGSYERLQDMKVAPYLLTSAIIGIVAQRLVRRNCPRCAEPDAADPEL
ncbi:MAG: type II/IV secretion system protein, partial [Planctomycetes bacterium]|nr:type II/IV secretion system protein [Planctomycetota bacterium]